MVTSEERIKVLQMIQEGKLTANEAAELLEAMDEDEKIPVNADPAQTAETAAPGRKPRWLRVRVTQVDSGRPKVNVRLPISMVNVGLKMGTRFAPEMDGMDTTSLMKMIEAGEIGQIVDVMDEKDGEHVEVFLE